MKLCARILLGLFAALCVAFSAQAVPVQWTLHNVTFTDGGTASGSFVYDAATNTYSSVSITTTPGTLVTPGATYHNVCTGVCTGAPSSSDGSLFLAVAPGSDLTGTRGLFLSFAAPLTDAAGGHDLRRGQEATCNDATCSSPEVPARSATGGMVEGKVIAAAVSIPTLGEWGLLTLVLLVLGVGLHGRRRAGR